MAGAVGMVVMAVDLEAGAVMMMAVSRVSGSD